MVNKNLKKYSVGFLVSNYIQGYESRIKSSHWDELVDDSTIDPEGPSHPDQYHWEGAEIDGDEPVSGSFEEKIQGEWCDGSAVAPTLYAATVKIIEDTGHWEPNRALNHKVSIQWQTKKPHSFGAIAVMHQESGEVWQAKPETPRPNWDKTKKQLKKLGWEGNVQEGLNHHPDALVFQKYEAPKGGGSPAYLPPVPPEIRKKVSERYGIDVPEDGSFWEWVEHHPVPMVPTEGGKKALALLSLGFIPLAFYGMYGGYRTKDTLGEKVAPYLTEDSKRFTQPFYCDIETKAEYSRTMMLAFDQDQDLETRRKVFYVNDTFGHLLEEQGCIVSIIEWDGQKGKGIDDFIANCGEHELLHVLDKAIPLWPKLGKQEVSELWSLKHQLKRPADLRVDIPTIENLDPKQLPDEGILALISQKGTGKTKLIAATLDAAPEGPQLLAGHRIALMRNLCSRLGMTYRGDLDQANGRFIDGNAYSISIGTCVDSLINPAFGHENFRGCDLVLDEVVQVIRHMLTSATCSRDGKRNAILRRFEALVKVARRIIIADADLDDAVINYIERLRGDGRKAFLIKNDYQPSPWDVTFIESKSSSAIVNQLLEDLKNGLNIFLATDSKEGSKRIQRLADTIKRELPGLLINSDTSGGDIEQAFITTPDNVVTGYSLINATPSMSTGTSIETPGHFDRVYGIFFGQSSTPADMLQALSRVRDPIKRVIWCVEQGGGFSRVTRDSRPEEIKRVLKEQLSATASILVGQLDTGIKDSINGYEWENPHIEMFSQIEADRNRSMWSLRSALKIRLIHEGHTLSILNLEDHKATQLLLKEAKEKIKQEYAQSIANAPNITQTEANALTKAEGLSPQEKLALEKFRIMQFYQTEVTPELVTLDDEGSYRRKLARLEAMMHPELAASRDTSDLNRQAQWQAGLTPWDAPTRSIQRQVRAKLNLPSFLDTEKCWKSDELETFKDSALELRTEIKRALGVTVKPEMMGAQILGMCLDQIGLKTKSTQLRLNGQRKRIYQLNPDVWGLALSIMTRRKRLREDQPEASHPPSKESSYRGVCDSLEHLIYTPKRENQASFSLDSEQQPELPIRQVGAGGRWQVGDAVQRVSDGVVAVVVSARNSLLILEEWATEKLFRASADDLIAFEG